MSGGAGAQDFIGAKHLGGADKLTDHYHGAASVSYTTRPRSALQLAKCDIDADDDAQRVRDWVNISMFYRSVMVYINAFEKPVADKCKKGNAGSK